MVRCLQVLTFLRWLARAPCTELPQPVLQLFTKPIGISVRVWAFKCLTGCLTRL
jgi:hypothetical protein